MIALIPRLIIALLIVLLCTVNLAFWGTLVVLTAPLKLLLPLFRQSISQFANKLMHGWVWGNEVILKTLTPTQWHIHGLDDHLDRNGSYLLICNHLSAIDIAVVTISLRRHVPMLKFFLKHQLLYLPFLGAACWALNMPFMRRYNAQQLAEDPQRQGTDIETTRRACRQFRHIPTCVINYVEGSRLTPTKHQQQQSPYTYLLKPKAGGIALAMAVLSDQIDQVLDLTLVYPGTERQILTHFLMGKLQHVTLDVATIPLSQIPQGDYHQDAAYRLQFQQWLNQRWQHKDKRIAQLLAHHQSASQKTDLYYRLSSE
ncbi:MAG: acyltransferase [Ferrimonas sp.]